MSRSYRHISQYENEILELKSQGMTKREIGEMLGINSFMLIKNQQVVAEGCFPPYDNDTTHILYSISKSITATALGFAIDEGKVSLDDSISKFFPEYDLFGQNKKSNRLPSGDNDCGQNDWYGKIGTKKYIFSQIKFPSKELPFEGLFSSKTPLTTY